MTKNVIDLDTDCAVDVREAVMRPWLFGEWFLVPRKCHHAPSHQHVGGGPRPDRRDGPSGKSVPSILSTCHRILLIYDCSFYYFGAVVPGFLFSIAK